MTADVFHLDRFVEAQERAYSRALTELREGEKQSHWIWYILPQMKGLGASRMSECYGITGLAEARAYLAHPVLGLRLIECIEAILGHPGSSAESILGEVDAMKFRSCLTLFCRAMPSVEIFPAALHRFFAGEEDPQTISLLEAIDKD